MGRLLRNQLKVQHQVSYHCEETEALCKTHPMLGELGVLIHGLLQIISHYLRVTLNVLIPQSASPFMGTTKKIQAPKGQKRVRIIARRLSRARCGFPHF